MMRALYVILFVILACSPAAPGGGGPTPDASSAADTSSASTPWAGSYNATITGVIVSTTGQSLSSTGSEPLDVSQPSADRATWARPGPCVIQWRVTGANATADAGQQCTAARDGAPPLQLRLASGTASLAGTTINSTLRWDVSMTDGTSVGTMTESIAAARR